MNILAKLVGNLAILVIDKDIINKQVTKAEWMSIQDVIFHFNAGDIDFEKAKEDLITIVRPVDAEQYLVKKEAKEKELSKIQVEDADDFLKVDNRFKKEGRNVFYKDFKIPVPQRLIDRITELAKAAQEHEHLVNFWIRLMQNPTVEARLRLYDFMANYHMTITKNGFGVAFKRVNRQKREVDNKLVNYVTNTHINVRTVKKKSPKNYLVYSIDKEFKLWNLSKSAFDPTVIPGNATIIEHGNLDTLFKSLSVIAETHYKDVHTGKMHIELGKPVEMPREECNHNGNQECSVGLHLGSPKYSFGGDTILLCLFDPADVVSVPYADAQKMRTCRYYPIAVLKDVKEMQAFEFETFDDEFAAIELEKAEERIKELEAIKMGSIVLKGINRNSINSEDIEEAKRILTNR